MKNKTLATWLTFWGGPLGLHRFYLKGMTDPLGWLLPIPTALGVYGLERVQAYGQDDMLSWCLIPLLGFNIAACALNAIVFGLMSAEGWNQRFNPEAPTDHSAGHTHWLTIGGVAIALLVGTAILMSSIVFSLQRYFEYQIREAQTLSQ